MIGNENLVRISKLTPKQIASICDHTFLNRSEAYKGNTKGGQSPVRLRADAFNSFLEDTTANGGKLPYAVCVRPEDVERTSDHLIDYQIETGNEVLVASVVGFPDGSLYDRHLKVAETEFATTHGAHEIDMVLNYNAFKAGEDLTAQEEATEIALTAHRNGAEVKLIFETSELSSDQIKRACELANEAGVDFVKTSTGFSSSGAKAEDLVIMRANFEGGVKISGGVNPGNVKYLLHAASGRTDGCIDLDPDRIRIGESSLLAKL
jgi:deoxyribose-phosphate aldolase